MSLEKWLARGRKIMIGGKEFILMPLPLKRLYEVGVWLSENCNDVVQEVLASKNIKNINPMDMATKVLLRVDMSVIAYDLLIRAKNPETGKSINDGLTREFLDEYLDTVAAQEFVKTFVEINELPNLIKNLQRLPVVQELMEIASSTFGRPYLNSLLPNTDSTQTLSEGSRSPKSTDTSTAATSNEQESGKPMTTSHKSNEKLGLIQ
jgi:hypothetical protein